MGPHNTRQALGKVYVGNFLSIVIFVHIFGVQIIHRALNDEGTLFFQLLNLVFTALWWDRVKLMFYANKFFSSLESRESHRGVWEEGERSREPGVRGTGDWDMQLKYISSIDLTEEERDGGSLLNT